MSPAAPGAFAPSRLLSNPHVQTLLGSRGRNGWVQRRAASLMATSESRLLTTPEGVKLQALTNLQPGAPTVIVIHGWLGHADSGYVLGAAAALQANGFSVIRLNLRDHGATAHLNEGLFHSARIREVVDAVSALQAQVATGPCGLLGFSLGGNFALRVANATGIRALAVCPAMDPAQSMAAIDDGWMGYRLFFVHKWRRALRAKQAAFPHLYDFSHLLRLDNVAALTDIFVRDHTPYACTGEYVRQYTLTGDVLEHARATIVYAEDDPVIPKQGFRGLPDNLKLLGLPRGGHCAFITHPRQPSWIDRFAAHHFTGELSP